ncbi:DUF6896 domain-containing protein [Neptunitalea lumnitzerae]|uniref:DUF6896 domain-containing protein n=1 Tax=Neptunitalea lumnitzerae TaxID=2965509 RepID=A0ABQ5MIZ1_9FLAO|nr:hypothetical protein [Neptunitalea sp. Y10]GLB49382.1 hypothetical protein Y10_17500 [Neptunitalea sp. Y10]
MTREFKEALQIKRIKVLFEENESLVLVFKSNHFEEQYIKNLKNVFIEHVVMEIKWRNELIIAPSISTSIVLDHLKEFYACIKLFDITAHSLMYLMAKTFDIDLTNKNEIEHLKRHRSVNQRGQLNNEWSYYFHGISCTFTNKKTQQLLDVKIFNGLEFGVLDTYYLMKFIETTKKCKELSLILNSNTYNMQKVIEVLKEQNYIVNISEGEHGVILNRNIEI